MASHATFRLHYSWRLACVLIGGGLELIPTIPFVSLFVPEGIFRALFSARSFRFEVRLLPIVTAFWPP